MQKVLGYFQNPQFRKILQLGVFCFLHNHFVTCDKEYIAVQNGNRLPNRTQPEYAKNPL